MGAMLNDPILDADPRALIAVHTTVGHADVAERIARTLVAQRLVACAQIDAVRSLYHWQGTLQEDNEHRLVLKTTAACWPALQRALRELHPYALPDVHAVPLAAVSSDYAEWVRAETTPGPAPAP